MKKQKKSLIEKRTEGSWTPSTMIPKKAYERLIKRLNKIKPKPTDGSKSRKSKTGKSN